MTGAFAILALFFLRGAIHFADAGDWGEGKEPWSEMLTCLGAAMFFAASAWWCRALPF